MTNENTSAWENFENDMNVIKKKLRNYLNQVNIFEVLGLTNTEIRHSNMLAWLFDSKANHGLENNFVKNFLEPKLKKEDKNKLNKYDFRAYRELEHIDLLLVSESEKIVVVIENKIGTKNHDNQLTKYSNLIRETYKDKNFSIYLFYLTPDGETPVNESEDISEWRALSYKDIIDNLDKAKATSKLKPEAKLLIDDYLKILRRDVVKDDNDELIKICNDIYAKYKGTIDLINKYKTSYLVTIIKSVLFNYRDLNIIKLDNIDNCTTTFKFYTSEMNEVLPGFRDERLSSWSDTHQYDYELIIPQNSNGKKLKLICSLSGNNIDEETKEKMLALIKKANKKIEGNNFTFCTLKTMYAAVDNTESEEQLKTSIESLINRMLTWQGELLKAFAKNECQR